MGKWFGNLAYEKRVFRGLIMCTVSSAKMMLGRCMRGRWSCSHPLHGGERRTKYLISVLALVGVLAYSTQYGFGLFKTDGFGLPKIKLQTVSRYFQELERDSGQAEPPLLKWLYTNLTTEMYLLSAYYDDRPTLEFTSIRIIGVADKGMIENNEEKVFCIVWGDKPDIGAPKKIENLCIEMDATHIGPGAWSHGKYFREYIFVCPLTNSSISTPAFVSVVDGVYLNKFENESNSVILKEALERLPKIHVQYPERPLHKIDFGQCTSISYWAVDPHRIVEWVELHRIWGVKEMNIYGSMVEETTERVFIHYHNEGFLKYKRILRPINDTKEPIFFMMASPVINDCIYKNMYRYNKIVVVDLDEVIAPRGNITTYTEMLDTIEMTLEKKHPNRMYMFQNVYFFFELPQDEHFPKELMTLRQVGRLRDLTPIGTAAKSIIDPMACTNMHNHFCWHVSKRSDMSSHTNYVDPRIGLNQHYKKCHFDRYMVAYNLPPCEKALKNFTLDYNMHRFTFELIPRVKIELDKLNLTLIL